MRHALFLMFSCLYASFGSAKAGAGWAYNGDLGPDQWYTQYVHCGGRMQSPINIEVNDVLYDQQLQSFDLRQYSVCTACKMVLENVNGHTAEVLYENGAPIYIRGGSLPDEYQLDQFHFHWGASNDRGSEHLLNNMAMPLEMHIVHHMKKYNKTEAASSPYGLAVLGFFFEIGDHNSAFDKLLSKFTEIQHVDNQTELKPFALMDLLPAGSGDSYYRYYGSLTTPPCYETVIWTIFTTKIRIAQAQLDVFRTLRTVQPDDANATEVELSNDFRPIQELHERRVTSNDHKLLNDISRDVVEQLRDELNSLKSLLKSSNSSPTLQPLFFASKLFCLVWGLFWVFTRR